MDRIEKEADSGLVRKIRRIFLVCSDARACLEQELTLLARTALATRSAYRQWRGLITSPPLLGVCRPSRPLARRAVRRTARRTLACSEGLRSLPPQAVFVICIDSKRVEDRADHGNTEERAHDSVGSHRRVSAARGRYACRATAARIRESKWFLRTVAKVRVFKMKHQANARS